MSGSFVERTLTVKLDIGTGTDGEGPPNTYTFAGYRVSANIDLAGNLTPPAAQISVYGPSLSDLNAVTTIGMASGRKRNNTVTLLAGQTGSQQSLVFQGSINESYGDFADMPSVALQVTSLTGGVNMLKPIPPTSYKGSVDAAAVLAGLAKQMGFTFENSGVSVILRNPYYSGTAYDQVVDCVTEANIDIDTSLNTIAIWPKSGHRNKQTPFISPATGMIGYPAYADNGVQLRTIYNPAIFPGGLVQVKSDIPAACGFWKVYTLGHTLESQNGDGLWESDVYCINIKDDIGT